MGLLKKLKKAVGKTVGAKVLGKALKHDPLGKALLKKDPLGRKIFSDATGGRSDDILKGGRGGGRGGLMARGLASRLSANAAAAPMNTGIVPPDMGGAPVPMAGPPQLTGPAPMLPPEMGGGMDPMYTQRPAMMTGGPGQMSPAGGEAGVSPMGPPMGGPPADMAARPPQMPMRRPMGRPSGGMMGGALARRRMMMGGGAPDFGGTP